MLSVAALGGGVFDYLVQLLRESRSSRGQVAVLERALGDAGNAESVARRFLRPVGGVVQGCLGQSLIPVLAPFLAPTCSASLCWGSKRPCSTTRSRASPLHGRSPPISFLRGSLGQRQVQVLSGLALPTLLQVHQDLLRAGLPADQRPLVARCFSLSYPDVVEPAQDVVIVEIGWPLLRVERLLQLARMLALLSAACLRLPQGVCPRAALPRPAVQGACAALRARTQLEGRRALQLRLGGETMPRQLPLLLPEVGPRRVRVGLPPRRKDRHD